MPRGSKTATEQSPELPVLQSQRLYKQIAEVLEGRIRSGAFPPGNYLPPERILAHQMGVSRTSVREALIALEVKGLVVIRVGDGVQVCEPATVGVVHELAGERSALEQLQARSLIEGEIAALAAKNASAEHLNDLDIALNAMDRSFSDPAQFLNADHNFHVAMAVAAGNQVLLDQLEHLWALRYQPTFLKFEEHYSNDAREQLAVFDDHRKIVAAIRSGNPNRARSAVRQHLKRVVKNFMK
ncbi:FadR/GntR family transcriptional regulator [Telmatospirillum sp.]|uniref:FadR/GntR family transcriptional regulator n=1 Tax=Telmatospirillum sp. TaxID=2079197 RepID=UPI00283EF66E|nr:FadR/GntR family transcriptional regulator [Telmatospirillum sp.]MDR3436262.1 FadR/GntR family transcriptional regulator [Telmatospirillum sp.]